MGGRRRPVLVEQIGVLRSRLGGARAAGLSVGLVPTMGGLHEGHLSLVRRAAAECDLTAVSVFVNPLQFGDRADLDGYPRDLARDLALAGEAGADLVFAPSVAEMYPAPPATRIQVEGLGSVLEGASRPGHFEGVAIVVAKLFGLAGPCRAYFGEKDWQQLLVVRRLAGDLSMPVEVVACATVREPDGLACSSRNVRLSPQERRAAAVLARALTRAAAAVDQGERDAGAVRQMLIATLAAEPLVVLDYAEVARADDLGSLDRLEGDVRLLVAARVGATRLIDNLGIRVPSAVPSAVAERSA